MIKKKIVGLLVMFCCAVPTWAQQWEVWGGCQAVFPRDSLWKRPAYGCDFKMIYWSQAGDWGVALNVARSQWEIEPFTLRQTNNQRDVLEGEVDYTGLGLSVVTRSVVPDVPFFNLTLEAGLNHMDCSGDIQVAASQYSGDSAYSDPLGTDYYPMETRDTWVGRVAATLELTPEDLPHCRLFVGGGYQWDVRPMTVTESWLGYEQTLDLTGGFVQAGVLIAF